LFSLPRTISPNPPSSHFFPSLYFPLSFLFLSPLSLKFHLTFLPSFLLSYFSDLLLPSSSFTPPSFLLLLLFSFLFHSFSYSSPPSSFPPPSFFLLLFPSFAHLFFSSAPSSSFLLFLPPFFLPPSSSPIPSCFYLRNLFPPLFFTSTFSIRTFFSSCTFRWANSCCTLHCFTYREMVLCALYTIHYAVYSLSKLPKPGSYTTVYTHSSRTFSFSAEVLSFTEIHGNN
jgi:hypothetical protein